MIFLILSLVILPFALLSRRLMGGLIGKIFPWWPGTQAGRGLWGGLLTLWAWFLSAALGVSLPWWIILGLGFSWPIGAILVANGGMSLRDTKDHFQILGHGVVMSALAVVLSAWFTGSWLVPAVLLIAGALTLACYKAAWAYPLDIKQLDCYKWDPPPTAELYQGLVQTAAIALAVVLMV